MDAVFKTLSLISLSSLLLFSPTLITEPHNALGRIFGLAVVDILATIAVAWVLDIPIVLAFITGGVAHFIFGIKTPLNTKLGLI